jgi:hypothetical protein
MLLSQCNLSKYIPTIAELRDPGRYTYTVSQAPTDQSYTISFYLEKQSGSLKAGKHTLGPAGIE